MRHRKDEIIKEITQSDYKYGFVTDIESDKAPDRKSVVQGKSVDLGGRRIIKKKKTKAT